MYNESSSLTLTGATYGSNVAEFWGGGMYNDSSPLTLTDALFSDNWATDGGGLFNANSFSRLWLCPLFCIALIL